MFTFSPSGWIFPVLSLLQDEQLYSSVPAGAGPRVLVLCPGHAECGHLAAVLRALAQQTRLHTAVVASTQGAATQEEAVQVANGCDILLTTPSRLAALLTSRYLLKIISVSVYKIVSE